MITLDHRAENTEKGQKERGAIQKESRSGWPKSSPGRSVWVRAEPGLPSGLRSCRVSWERMASPHLFFLEKPGHPQRRVLRLSVREDSLGWRRTCTPGLKYLLAPSSMMLWWVLSRLPECTPIPVLPCGCCGIRGDSLAAWSLDF